MSQAWTEISVVVGAVLWVMCILFGTVTNRGIKMGKFGSMIFWLFIFPLLGLIFSFIGNLMLAPLKYFFFHG